jgi:hypothetical protein
MLHCRQVTKYSPHYITSWEVSLIIFSRLKMPTKQKKTETRFGKFVLKDVSHNTFYFFADVIITGIDDKKLSGIISLVNKSNSLKASGKWNYRSLLQSVNVHFYLRTS